MLPMTGSRNASMSRGSASAQPSHTALTPRPMLKIGRASSTMPLDMKFSTSPPTPQPIFFASGSLPGGM